MLERKIHRAAAKALAALAVAAALGAGAALYLMARGDREHARFFETGRSVNNFLGGYTEAVREGFAKGDAGPVAELYSERFDSPARGRWVLRADADEGDVAVSRLAAEGSQDCSKAELREEVARYFATLSSVQNVW